MSHNSATYAAMDRLGKLFTHSAWSRDTWLQDESAAYPNGGQTRMGRAIADDNISVRVWVGIADTYWTAPAHTTRHGKYVAGWVVLQEADDTVTLRFHANANRGHERW